MHNKNNTMNTDQQESSHIAVQAQYIKDFSFENPRAPESMINTGLPPQIDLSLDLNINKLPEDDYYEVEISITVKSFTNDQVLYLVDLKYAGIFHLINISDDKIEILLAVHCPAILFPYVRKLVGDVTQSGGFQPLMIDPVDFSMLYHKKMLEAQRSAHEPKNSN